MGATEAEEKKKNEIIQNTPRPPNKTITLKNENIVGDADNVRRTTSHNGTAGNKF